MKTIISNYTELQEFCGTHQITAQEVLNGITYGKAEGQDKADWQDITIAPEFRKQIISDLCAVYGGRKPDELKRAFNCTYPPQHWAIGRTFYEATGWAYCAGQDYPSELNQLRKYLYNY